VEQSDNTAKREDDEPIASTRFPTSTRLLAAIHRGDEAAIKEFFLLYVPLLRDQARRMSIGPDERGELVTTLLDDVVLHLMEHQIAPRHLSRYLVASLRNRARNWHRDSHRRNAAHERAYAEPGTSKEKIVAECHSEYAIRSSGRALLDSLHSARTPIASLAERLGQALTRDETVLIIWVGRHAPLREVAAQLGITYSAARVRLYRLRERLRKLAIDHLRTLKLDERQQLERFFRRAEVSLTRETATKQQEKANGQF
jgi:RNA polymerase sigma factor (sigma-70 family)